MTISVILPTLWRPSLTRALGSVSSQLLAGDEILLVGEPRRAAVFGEHAVHPQVFQIGCDVGGDAGDTERREAVKQAKGDYLMFLDDDDEMLPDTMTYVHRLISANPGAMFLCRVALDSLEGMKVWQTKEPRPGNFCHPIIIVPRAKCGSWSTNKEACRVQGDQIFGMSCVKKVKGNVIFDERVIGIIHKHPDRPVQNYLTLHHELGEIEKNL